MMENPNGEDMERHDMERLERLEKSCREMDHLIRHLTEEMVTLCGPDVANREATNPSENSDFTPDKLDGRTWQQTYDAMVGRDASLDKYMAYGDSALAILDEYDLSVHHKIERWEAMEKLFSEQRLTPEDGESIAMQARITSLVSLAGKQKVLPKEVLAELQTHPARSRLHKNPITSSNQVPIHHKPKKPMLTKPTPSVARTATQAKLTPSSVRSGNSGLLCQTSVQLGGGMELGPLKRPVIISRKKKNGEGAAAPPPSPAESTPWPGVSVPDEIDLMSDDSLFLTDAQNLALDEILKSCIPDFPSLVGVVRAQQNT